MAKRLLFGNSRWGMIMRVIVLFTILTAPLFYHYGVTFILGRSMYPTYECSEYVIVDKNYGDYVPSRYDVIEINMGSEKWIKRIIGLPGDHIEYGNGRVWINGERDKRFEYLNLIHNDKLQTRETVHITVDLIVPNGMLWVIGDNRIDSAHSLIRTDDIAGKVLY